MSTTYSTNDDLKLDNGKSVNDFMDISLSAEEITTQKDNARTRAYNYINERYLDGKTTIPASSISSLKEVEIDLVIANLMGSSFSMETANTSDWAELYKERALEVLNNLKFSSTSEIPSVDSENIGNGTISAITTNDLYTRTEQWILRAESATQFSVIGSRSGRLPIATVGTQYPEKDWGSYNTDYNFTLNISPRFEKFPISFLITAGVVAFSSDDKFIFKTYSASSYKQREGRFKRG